MGYINDVFISYKRGSINEQWLDEIFLPLFETYLNSNLEDEPKIFVDRNSIIDGSHWDEFIAYQLAHSKCMVAIISPSYFFKRSEWCIREFISMKYREEILDLKSYTKPPCLIWPVMLQSIEKKPLIIQPIQMKDYSAFYRVGEGFKKTEAYYHFQDKLSSDCKIIISIIKAVPKWRQEWESENWKTEIESRVQEYFYSNQDPKQDFKPW